MDKARLIYKVLSGRASDPEREDLDRWIAGDPANAEEFEDIKLLYEADLNYDERKIERDGDFYEGLRNIQLRIEILKQKRKRTEFYKTVGITLLIWSLVSTLVYFQYGSNDKSEAPSELNDPASGTLAEVLVFENATLKDIFDVLESKCHLVIRVSDNDVLLCRFTGTFYRGITVDNVLRALAQSEGLDITFRNTNTFELHGKGCPVSIGQK